MADVVIKAGAVENGFIVKIGGKFYVAKTKEELGEAILKGLGAVAKKPSTPASKPRRKRRTKAEMEAERAAKAAKETEAVE